MDGVGVENQKSTLKEIERVLEKEEVDTIMLEINQMPKLRTYKVLKQNTGTEEYISSKINRTRRSLLAKTRLGVLPINIELGRHRKQKLEDRTCPNCPDRVEDESHFLTTCPLYHDIRRTLFQKFEEKNKIKLQDLDDMDALFALLNVNTTINIVGKFIEEALILRSKSMQRA